MDRVVFFSDYCHEFHMYWYVVEHTHLPHYSHLFAFICLFTALIAGRVWWIQRKLQKTGVAVVGRDLTPALIVVIESGAIYSACLIILLALYLSGSFAQYILLDGVSSSNFRKSTVCINSKLIT